jgi:nitroreductase
MDFIDSVIMTRASVRSFTLAAHSLGLGAVWTAVYPDAARLESVRRILGIPVEIVPLNVVPIGEIAGEAPLLKDKWNEGAVRFDSW